MLPGRFLLAVPEPPGRPRRFPALHRIGLSPPLPENPVLGLFAPDTGTSSTAVAIPFSRTSVVTSALREDRGGDPATLAA
jgi:hypothetical protein